MVNPVLGLLAGATVAICWMLGTWALISVFRTKPRTMKQVAGDSSTQVQVGCQTKGDSDS